ncbi:Phosphatidylinositol-4-phosphate 5-kinase [Geranomyces variabilis]|uniref:Phosphatidylinositol-4-phosphate 5-kinase n=1 Tax=Geranomyces variabilis TaxID=109894 RepID=A0AAD5TJC1_9FUNG|nr:Phosphatidylinositol-4-phosphate 5-kinase [Geranomyces variabilis]
MTTLSTSAAERANGLAIVANTPPPTESGAESPRLPTPLGSTPASLRVSFKDLPKVPAATAGPDPSLLQDAITNVAESPAGVTESAAGTQHQRSQSNHAPSPLEQPRSRAATNPLQSSQSRPTLSSAEAALAALQKQPQDPARLLIDPRKRPNSFSGPASVSPQQPKSIIKGTSHSVGTPRQNEILSTAKHLIPLSEIESSSPRRRVPSSLKKLPSGNDDEHSDHRDSKFARRLTRQRSEKEVLVGTPVKEGHENFVLMYDMLTGIRVAVSRCQAKPSRVLVKEDFKACHKMTFDFAGTELTPSSRYDFKFKDYAPWVFRCVRDAFNVDPAEYLLSLTGKYVLSELGSPGKSGSFFYYSSDYRYIIKTIKKGEKKALMGFITWYYEHCRTNPNTTLCRILGLHRVKLKGNRKLHFVVMLNVFPPNKDIHEMYDLKGSTVGREFPEELAKDDPRAVLKDLNWMARGRKLRLGPAKSTLLIEQLEKDVQFLIKHKIMDYSLLVGIHDLKRGNTENIRDKTLAVYEPNPEAGLSRQLTVASLMMSRPSVPAPTPAAAEEGALSGDASGSRSSPIPIQMVASPESSIAVGPGGLSSSPSAASTHAPISRVASGVPSSTGNGSPAPDAGIAPVAKATINKRDLKRLVSQAEPQQLGASTADLPTEAPAERAACVFYGDDGGFRASDAEDRPIDYLYYIGTIDIFTTYDITKKIEHFWKSLSEDPHEISAVNPRAYGERFMAFMKKAIKQNGSTPPRTPPATPNPLPPLSSEAIADR